MSSRLTAMDIEKQEFSKKLRGLDAEEVRMFLRSVAEEVERLNLDNGELRDELGLLRREMDEFRSREHTLQQTLISAQRMTDELKERARAQAEIVLKEARLQADDVLRDGQDQLTRLEAEISRCKLERDLFENRLRNTIAEHLDLLDRRREEGHVPDNVRMMQRRSTTEAG